ncbi:MAG: Fic/DOC family N-terminal domain-containing protein [Bacteroidales bacterium]
MKALINANKALAELKGIAKRLPNPSMLVNTIALSYSGGRHRNRGAAF